MAEFFDKNMVVKTTIDKKDIKYYDLRSGNFEVFGLYDYLNQKEYVRMPEEVAKKVSEGVVGLNKNTSGGRIAFKTNSNYVAIIKAPQQVYHGGNITGMASAGVDMYVKRNGEFRAFKAFIPTEQINDVYAGVADLPEGEKEIIMYLPLYSGFTSFEIGVQENAYVEKINPYKNVTPILYYGSSITQGGCATRPSSAYQAIISRWNNIDYTCLGFSGCAKGEDAMIEYLSTVKSSVFVLDYDHNAESPEHLNATHEKLFKAYRAKNPNTPVIMITRPNYYDNLTEPNYNFSTNDAEARRQVILKTYNNALNAGDKNVYFIDGKDFYPEKYFDICTIEGLHPNDLGFMFMAEGIYKVLKEII